MSIYDYASSADMKTAGDIAAALNTDHELHEALLGPGVSLADGAFDPHIEPAFHRPQKDTPLVTTDDVVRLAEAEGVATETVGNALLPRATLYSLSGVREALGLPAVAETGARRPEDQNTEPDPDARPNDLLTVGMAATRAGTDRDTIKALLADGAVRDWSTPMLMTNNATGETEQVPAKPMVSLTEVTTVLTNTLGL
ncbi:hypothetical protein [Corynebacterium variabile]|uniref:hypothetical protein n=1 Tax=Corynebacterium variabile TaxID=1727 RepID=UPI003A94ED44